MDLARLQGSLWVLIWYSEVSLVIYLFLRVDALRVYSLRGWVKVYGTLVWKKGLREILLELLSRLLVIDILWLGIGGEVLIWLMFPLSQVTIFIFFSSLCWHLRWTLHHLLPTKSGTCRGTILVVILGRPIPLLLQLLIVTGFRVLHIHVGTEDWLIAHRRFVLIIYSFQVFRWISSLATVLTLIILFLSQDALLWWRLLRRITNRWANMLPPLAWSRVLLVWWLSATWGAHSFGFTGVVDILVVILGCGCRHRILSLDIFSNVAALDPLSDLWPLRIAYLELLGLLRSSSGALGQLGGKGGGRLLALCLWSGRWGAYLHCALWNYKIKFIKMFKILFNNFFS